MLSGKHTKNGSILAKPCVIMMRMMRQHFHLQPRFFLFWSLLFVLVAAACGDDSPPDTSPGPSNNTQRRFTLASIEQTATPARAEATQIAANALRSDDASATPFPSNTPVVCTADPNTRQIRYGLEIELDYDSKRAEVLQTVHYRNDHNAVLDELVFHVEPRRLTGVMQFQEARDASGNRLPDVALDGWRLTVPLETKVFPGCVARVQLAFALQIEPYASGNPIGWLSYSQRQLNMAHWFPTLGIYGYQTPGVWYTPRMHFIGEQAITQIADFDVALTIQNMPDGLEVAAPGIVARVALNAWEMQLHGARDFAMSMSTEFIKSTADVDGIALELYYYPSADSKSGGLNPSARAMLDAEQAIELYTERFGPFPYDRMLVVEGDFPDGLEFSGLVFVSEAWFRTWNGTVQDWLTIITVHEIAHQWWYASVGSNQGATPYLDEALATYSEVLYYETYYPDMIDWWWDFRIFTYGTADTVDATVYDYSSWRPYINAVYLGGCLMFQAIRDELGDPTFSTWLADYAARYREQIAGPREFWGTLSMSNYERVAGIRQRFLRDADILPPMTVSASRATPSPTTTPWAEESQEPQAAATAASATATAVSTP